MLNFRFRPEPAMQKQQNVSLQLVQFRRQGEMGVLDWQLDYGKTQAEFESFESWTVANRLEWVSPEGKATVLVDPEIRDLGMGRYRIRYRFDATFLPQDINKWELVYRTPARVYDVMVPVTLKNIPLP